jgi:hypothetical protein
MALALGRRALPILALWAGAALLVFVLPARGLRTPEPPGFPGAALITAVVALALLVAGVLAAATRWGPQAARHRLLALAEAPPELFWGGLLLALWPAAWGPPGRGALAFAFLLALGPGELRWVASALPAESPFPEAWGAVVLRRSRRLALRRLALRWIAVRLPFWITATLLLEALLGVPGLGLDWSTRLARADHAGLLIWIAGFALLHLLAPDEVEA